MTIATIPRVETIGKTSFKSPAIFGKNLCAKIPSTIGTITTLTTLKNIAITFTSML